MRKSILSLLLILPILLSAKTLTGKIVKIQDGDTVTLLDNTNTQYKIRLDEIDAPESKQAYGAKSKQYLSSMIAGKTVTVEYTKTDQYKRILGTIFYKGKNINEEMVRSGYAWGYYYNKNKRLLWLQKVAKENKRGLWADKNAIDPYHFRKSKKKH